MMTMKDRREHAELTVKKLATRANHRITWVDQVEAGTLRPRPRGIKALAKALHCTIGDVLVSLAATQIAVDGGEHINYSRRATGVDVCRQKP